MAVQVRPGISTAQLSEIGAKILAAHGAHSPRPRSTISQGTSASA
jgi:hypothetical protein